MPLPLPRPLMLWVLAICLSSFTTLARAQQPVGPPAPKHRHWTTNWSFQDIDVKRLLSRLASIGLSIPIDAEGDVSVEFQVGVPLTSLRDGKAYRFDGHIQAKRLRLESLLLEDFDAEVSYADGLLCLEDVRGRWSDADGQQAGGSMRGDAVLHVLPRGDFQADIRAESLPIGPLHDLVVSGADARPMSGVLSGQLHLSAPIDSLRRVTAWTVDGDLEIDDLQFGETMPLRVDTGPIQMRDAVVLADQVVISSDAKPDLRMDVAAEVELGRRRRFQFRIRGDDVPLDALSQMLSPEGSAASGKLDIDVSGNGELATEKWSVGGQIGSPRLKILGQDVGLVEHEFQFDHQHLEIRALDPGEARDGTRMLLKQLSAEYHLDEQALHISNMSASLFDGSLEGTATLARQPELAHQANVKWKHLHPALSIARLLPRETPFSAVSSGTIDWSATASDLDSPASHTGIAAINLERITIGASHVGDVQLSIQIGDGKLHLVGTGELLGGTCELEATSIADADDSWSTLLTQTPEVHAAAQHIQLDRIARLVNPLGRRKWRGRVSARLQQSANGSELANVSRTLQLRGQDIALDRCTLSRQMDVRLELRGDLIAIESVSGTYAGGRLWADGQWSLGGGRRRLQFRLSGVKANDALLPISATAASNVHGKVSGTVTVTGEDGLRFRGAITARDSSLFSVPTGTLHTGIAGSASVTGGRWKVALPSIHGELAGGRFTGEAELSSSAIGPRAFDLASRWDARQIDFGQLLSGSRVSSAMAHGRVTGGLSLGGRSIRGVSDLSGRFDAKLGATQAAAIPGLVEADRFLGVVSLARTRFKEGRLSGVIGAGAATIDEFWLTSDRVKFWSEGKIQLANQRLDLDVIVSTGNFQLGDAKLLAFASQLALQATFPVATLIEVNRLLSNRTIHLDFQGPMTDPRVRLKPLAILREEAVRFLIRELLVAASVSRVD